MSSRTIYFKETGESLKVYTVDADAHILGGEYVRTFAETDVADEAEESEINPDPKGEVLDMGNVPDYITFKLADLQVIAQNSGLKGWKSMDRDTLIAAIKESGYRN